MTQKWQLLFATALFLLAGVQAQATAKLTWQQAALRMTGESDQVRKNAIQALSKTAQLEDKLRTAIQSGTDRERALALDTLLVFRFESLVPLLRSSLQKDTTGQMHLTLAVLSPSSERHKTELAFLYELDRTNTPAAARMAVLSTFSKWRLLIPSETLRKFLSDESVEVRFAAFSYIRTAILEGRELKFIPLVQTALSLKPYQLRLRSLFLVNELHWQQKQKFLATLSKCKTDSNLSVKALCEAVHESATKKKSLTTQQLLEKSSANKPTLFSQNTAGVFFGYKDARPAPFVGDTYEQAYFSDFLTKNCQAQNLCGFSRIEDDAETYTKTISSGFDRKAVYLRVVNSSLDDNDDRNRKNPFQHWQSEHARAEFQNSLFQDKAVFYNGHSRDGGGPDFEPPKLTAIGQHVNYSHYRRNRNTFNEMKRLLRMRRPSPAISVELYSCASKTHFQRALGEALGQNSPTSLRLFSELIYTADAMSLMIHSIGDLIPLLKR